MADRRTTILDAAVDLLGGHGPRGLTHRAVDAEAGLPAGSTSNYFRTREALLLAVAERVAERERAHWEALAVVADPRTPAELAAVLGEAARGMVGQHRRLTLARYAFLVEGAQNPALHAGLAATGAKVNAYFLEWLRVIGSGNPDRDLHVIANYVTGLVLHEAAHPSAAFD